MALGEGTIGMSSPISVHSGIMFPASKSLYSCSSWAASSGVGSGRWAWWAAASAATLSWVGWCIAACWAFASPAVSTSDVGSGDTGTSSFRCLGLWLSTLGKFDAGSYEILVDRKSVIKIAVFLGFRRAQPPGFRGA